MHARATLWIRKIARRTSFWPCGIRCVGGSAPCECALTSRSALGVAACAPLGVRGYLGHRRQRQQRRLWGWPLCRPHGRCFRRLHVACSRPRNAQAPRGAALRRRCAERGARAGVARVVPVVSMLSQFRLTPSPRHPERAAAAHARRARALRHHERGGPVTARRARGRRPV